MIHRDPDPALPLFAQPPDPGDDAAPLAGGACVNGRNDAQNLTRLRLSPPASHNAPRGTSEVAAARIAGHAAKQRADVLAVIVRAGAAGATDAEIEAATGIRAQSVSPRRGELRDLGLIVDTGQRRPTPRGRPAAVWVASTIGSPAETDNETPPGRELAEGGAK